MKFSHAPQRRLPQCGPLSFLTFAACMIVWGGEPGRIALDEAGVDFGVLDQQKKASRVLTVRNTGAGTLRIIELLSDCGCAKTEPDVREIPPGGAGRLTITFNSGNLSGPVNKTLTVRSSDPVHPTKELFIRANVQPVFVFTPQILNLGGIQRGQPATGQADLREAKGRPFTVKRITSSHADLKAECEPIAGSHGAAHRIKIALAPQRRIGPAFFNVVAETDRQDRPMLQFMVICDVLGPVRVSPQTVFLGMGVEGTVFPPKTITVTNTGPNPIEIKSVDPGHPSLSATVTTVTPGREFTIKLAMRHPLPAGSMRWPLRIITTDSDDPVEAALVAIVRKQDKLETVP